jgi:predicted lipoprotein with Yx(FWY)xxD motif
MLKLRSLLFVSALLCLLMVASVGAQEMGPTVSVSSSEELGQFLVSPEGMTLYLFTPDPLDESVCFDQCLVNWPALTVESADDLTAGEGVPGELGVTERSDDGTLQVTYNGIPLYYWVEDAAPGDTTGQGVGGVWWVVPPATVYASNDDELGHTLVGPTGMTVYIFTNDTPGTADTPAVSNCADQCAENWPPLTVESADAIVPGLFLPGEFATTERADGTLQVTYNGWPLYYWAQDAARGDTTGEGVGDVWFTVAPETVTVSNSADLGDFLVAPNGMTLYKFDNDAAGVSNCADQCAENWPPFTVGENDRLVGGAGVMGELATIERADGGLQVTYNGMPLYYWAQDAAPGDTTGQGVGEVWWVVAP